MLGTTLGTVVDDLMKDFNQLFDDKRIQKSQVAHWVIMLGNKLLSQHISKRDSGQYLSVYAGVPIEVSTENIPPDIIKNRKYITLPESIFDYDMDGGIEYISYWMETEKENCEPLFTQITFNRTTPGESGRLYLSDYEKPKSENPFFYRVGCRIYFLGIECINPKTVEIGIYSTIRPVTDEETDLSKPLKFPEETLIILKRQVLDLGRFVLMMPEERVNDGIDTENQKQVPTMKLTSVNELSEDATTNK